MNSWKECKLGDVAEINMGQSPKSEFYNQDKIGLPFLQGNRTFGLKYPYFDTYCSEPTKIAKHGEILFSVRAPVGDINIANDEICIGRGLCSINSKDKNNEFLYYLLHFLKNEIINNESGSVFGSINRTDLSNINVLYPPIEEQKAIAEILSSLDDKIDLLHRQNQTLESLAQTLFRQWFIEEAKEEWEIGTFNDLVEVSSGKSLKRELFDDTGKYEVLGANGKIGKTNEWLFEEKLIYTGRVGTLGKVFLIDEVKKVWLSDNTLIIKPKRYFYFIYFLMIEFNFEEFNVGSTQPLIRQSDLKNIEILLPNDKLILKFEEQAKDIFIKINKNKKQIQTLENLRDTLLPKLLSGEVRVEI